ncbi:ORF6N domain-containing protein [Loigolactobacillus bifermentans]|uniref:Phage anti-repressor protein n=1 Tax=Loigolactobacillus bifermentans DSM 20003 TaxID=1423726 RepID=A0A0R1GKE5_9LACO|nr:ORF6N domain-containing protein [Loigolactobacillus bifermentans]KRK34393.1 Phage anti-repressor protein [Loigolactobacillus bifermentans DSM 20003]QGG60099.1 hypothetical protein LB003_06340 [Loigolactobacillus bifermentans]
MKLSEIKYADQLILTTEQLAEFYDTTADRIKQNFAYNKDKFEEGKHYFLLEGSELKRFKNQVGNSDLVAERTAHLYLWTKRGASRHSKMLGTDRAWDMYDALEENYFNRPQFRLPETPEEKIQVLLENSGNVNKKLKLVDKRVKALEDDQSLTPSEYSYLSRRVNHKVAEYVEMHNMKLNREQRARLFKDISTGINEVANVRTRIQVRKKSFDAVCDFIEAWVPSVATTTIVKQLGDKVAQG